ncbi:peptidyl-prolyl cis-trans isomerase FKBP20-2, chloroplastic-like [Juglans microcarpa x Juglans regia]|uniref:peptidyl-prolyl cis-trans isomerase FKBP20-2, chloroplastic-like n=1 Tax=Juglans microcarpa x Juglans regia TaxID=2249226 RepID=UPI001B7E73EB|nr:peptidyl-prolyl cis-trans isomerase FKBP20-2, chloroplastic-like [Juglans microcarpa x Juglans regia]
MEPGLETQNVDTRAGAGSSSSKRALQSSSRRALQRKRKGKCKLQGPGDVKCKGWRRAMQGLRRGHAQYKKKGSSLPLYLLLERHSKNPYDKKHLLEQNKWVQKENNAPEDFPSPLQVTFHYVGYNESGRRIDSTYLQGSSAKIRLGNNALVPGEKKFILEIILILSAFFVGPSTFFSSKQFEVFDVELLSDHDCQWRTISFYSDVVCN